MTAALETPRFRSRTRLTALLVALAVVTAAALWWLFGGAEKAVTAYFARAVGVYVGSDVRVLGVAVGEVREVIPRGEQVEVRMAIDPEIPVAADTNAVVVAPSVVSDRYVQLSTLSDGAQPLIADGAVIPVERTATPVELDELYASLNDLVVSLGPDGANATGALSDLLDVGAANLGGNGETINRTVRDLADLFRTLDGSDDDLFGTVDELQKFTTMLANNDQAVLQVNKQLAAVTQTLADDRDELSEALRTLGLALADIQEFIRDNRKAIKSNVDKLARTTQLLVDRRASLSEALDVAPLAVTNLLAAFDPASETLQGRANLLEYLPLPASGPVYAPKRGGGR